MDIAIILILGLALFLILHKIFIILYGSFDAVFQLYLGCCIVAVFLIEVLAMILPYILMGIAILGGIVLVISLIIGHKSKEKSIDSTNSDTTNLSAVNKVTPVKEVNKRSIKPIARTNVDIIITDELLTKKIPLSRIINSITEIDMDKAMRLVERRDFRLFENLAPEEANMVIHKLYINHIQFELFER